MPLSLDQAAHILSYLESLNSSLCELNITVLRYSPFASHSTISSLQSNTHLLLDTLSEHPHCQHAIEQWAHVHVTEQLTKEVTDLTRKSSGWHFGASTVRIEKLESFDLSVMVREMNAVAPHVCNLISCLLEADGEANRGREVRRVARVLKAKRNKKFRRGRMRMHDEGDGDSSDGSDTLWEKVDAVDGHMGVEGEGNASAVDPNDSDGSDDLWAQMDDLDGMVGGDQEEDSDDRPSYLRKRVLMIVSTEMNVRG